MDRKTKINAKRAKGKSMSEQDRKAENMERACKHVRLF